MLYQFLKLDLEFQISYKRQEDDDNYMFLLRRVRQLKLNYKRSINTFYYKVDGRRSRSRTA